MASTAQILPAAGSGLPPEREAVPRGAPTRPRATRLSLPDILLLSGCAAVFLPTLVRTAQEGWNTEQGAHGPIVFVTGLWLLTRTWREAAGLAERGMGWLVALLVVALLPAWYLSRITALIQLEGFLAYGLVLTAAYSRIGGPALRRMLFPLFYLAFIFPFPDTVVDTLTLPMKIGISHASAWFLALFGYPVGGQGVMLQIGQYQLLVAAACAGLNSIVSLGALSLLYIHLRYGDRLGYALVFAILIIPIAMLANFVRVLILLLLTYHFGEHAAQGYMHTFAGLVMFSVALAALGAADLLLQRFGPAHRTARPVPA
jgi:exosortase